MDFVGRYTSLGSTYNTFPNPLLKDMADSTVLGGWRPAWELTDETKERAGRCDSCSTRLGRRLIDVVDRGVPAESQAAPNAAVGSTPSSPVRNGKSEL